MGGALSSEGGGPLEGEKPRALDPRKDPFTETIPRFTQELIKCIVVGHGGCGKTALIRRLVNNSFLESAKQTVRQAQRHHPTHKVELFLRPIKCENGDTLTLSLWDEATVSPVNVNGVFFSDVDCVILMFDLSDQQAFDKLPLRIRDYCNKLGIRPPQYENGDSDEEESFAAREKLQIPVFVVGNKADDRARIKLRQTQRFAKNYMCAGAYHISARTDQGVGELVRGIRDWFLDHPKFSKEEQARQYEEGIARAKEVAERIKREREEELERKKKEEEEERRKSGKKPVEVENEKPPAAVSGPRKLEKLKSAKTLPTLLLPGGKKIGPQTAD